MNANLIFKWLHDPRYAPEVPAELDTACFLPVEVDTADGHRLRISGTYDPDALARLIRGLSG